MAGVLLLVIGFGSSSALAAAYGISVTGAMAIDTILAGLVAARRWGWGVALARRVFGLLLVVDLAYLAANVLKIPSGGWLPLVVAAGFSAPSSPGGAVGACCATSSMDTAHGAGLPRQARPDAVRVPGTAVFMTGNPDVVPVALLHNLKHNKVLHERVVLMTVRARDVPHVPGRSG